MELKLPLQLILAGPKTVCFNSTTNVYTTQSGNDNYTWQISGGGTITNGAGTNQVTVTWNEVGTKSISVNYTIPGGCNAPSPAVYSLTVNPAFNGGTLSSSAQTICYNTTPSDITYSAAPSGGSTPEYQWYKQTGSVSAPSGAFAQGSWAAVGTVSTSTPTLTAATIGNI